MPKEKDGPQASLLARQETVRQQPGCLARHVPIMTWLPQYEFEWLQMDVACGITLGLMCLSQTLAQAAIAGVTPISGPYTALVPPIVYAFLGTSRHCSVSSGSMGAILIASVLDPNLSIVARTELATLLSLVAGLFQILMGMCNLAFSVRFLSQATISGFTSGAAILIIASQVKSLCGFVTPPPASGPLEKIWVGFTHWHEINPVNFGLCVFLLALLEACKRTKAYAKKKMKAPMSKGTHTLWAAVTKAAEMKEVIVMIVGATFAYATMQSDGSSMIPILGTIPEGLPGFQLPFGDATLELWNGPTEKLHSFVISGMLIAFTAFLTTYASNKKLAMAYQYDLDASQELFALGAACAAGSFFGAFPVCGSLSRTALAGQIGSKTQVCSLVVAGIIALSLLFLSKILFFLPKCALAAIVITSAVNLFDFQTPKEIWQSSKEVFRGALGKDFYVWCIGFACTVQLGALWGIGIAVSVGLGQVLAEATTPKTAVLGAVEELGGVFRDIESYKSAKNGGTLEGILIFEVRGPLCFCSAEGFHEDLLAQVTENTKGIVLCFGAVEYIDYSALSVLTDLLTHFKHDHIKCVIADCQPNVELVLKEKLGAGEKPLVKDLEYMSISEAVSILEGMLHASAGMRESLENLTASRIQDAHHFHDIHHTHLPQ